MVNRIFCLLSRPRRAGGLFLKLPGEQKALNHTLLSFSMLASLILSNHIICFVEALFGISWELSSANIWNMKIWSYEKRKPTGKKKQKETLVTQKIKNKTIQKQRQTFSLHSFTMILLEQADASTEPSWLYVSLLMLLQCLSYLMVDSSWKSSIERNSQMCMTPVS